MSAPPSAPSLAAFSFTKLSRAVAVVLVFGYGVQLVFPSAKEFLCLVPGRTLPCVWNVLSAGLIEKHVAKLLVSIIGLLLAAKVVEPVWGSKEFLKFLNVINLMTGVATFALMYILYLTDQSGQLLYTEICGFHGILAGLLVAIKQIMPDNDVALFVFIKFRAKHLPVLFLLATVTASVYFRTVIEEIPFVVFGTYFSWFYLRFLQQRTELPLKGDPSDEFRFATFFPEPLRPIVDGVAGALARLFRLQGGSAPADMVHGYVAVPSTLPGTDSAESSRRRERGARALEERLGLKAAQAASPQRTDLEKGSQEKTPVVPDS